MKLSKIAMTGLFAALSYVVFTFLQIKITLPGGDATSIHLGNAVCVLGALILGGFYGGVYVIYAPKTFILKLCIGLITGFVAHRLGHIDESSDQGHVLRFAAAGAVCGLVFNMIFDPLFGYYYKLLILGKPAAELALVWNVASTSINAVLSAIASLVIYMPLRRALIRSGLVDKLK